MTSGNLLALLTGLAPCSVAGIGVLLVVTTTVKELDTTVALLGALPLGATTVNELLLAPELGETEDFSKVASDGFLAGNCAVTTKVF